MFISTGSQSAYICASTDSNQDDILENVLFDGAYFITVSEGQYLETNRCTFFTADASHTVALNADGSFGEGMYRVGIDIPAGEYKLVSESDTSGYWCTYNSSTIPLDIEDNNIFDNSSYVTVREGQYLELSRCTATPV